VQGRQENSLFDKGFDIFVGMHADQVLFEVVETWPELAGFGASRSEATIHARFADMFAVHGLFVSVEVVDSCESDLAPWTTLFDTPIGAGVSSVMLSEALLEDLHESESHSLTYLRSECLRNVRPH
jgi:hypothetical protein